MKERELAHALAEAPTIGGGRYRLLSKVGDGGKAAVFRAWDQREHAWRALKILLPEYARKKKVRRRFQNEAELMATIRHRHVIRVFDVGEENNLPFFAMELAQGGCLAKWSDLYGPMPPRMAVDVILQVCKGLKAAHDLGVIHRDVKPHNVLVTRQAVCKVTDFGIAQIAGPVGSMTKTGSVLGTLGYMAPEQRSDSKGVDARADVYSVGATLYKLLTGGAVADLFLAEHDASMLAGVPECLAPIVLRSSCYRPDDRYEDVVQLARALHRARRELAEVPEDTPSLVMSLDDRLEGDGVPEGRSEPTLPEVLSSLGAWSDLSTDGSGGDPTTDHHPIAPADGGGAEPRAPRAERRSAASGLPGQFTASPPEVRLRAGSGATPEAGSTSRADAGSPGGTEPPAGGAPGSPPEGDPAPPSVPPTPAWLIADEVDPGRPSGESDAGRGPRSLPATVFASLAGPFKVSVIPLLLLVLVCSFLVVSGAVRVNRARRAALDARTAIYDALRDERGIVDDLAALGANRAGVETMYRDFAEEEREPDRLDAALEYVGFLDAQLRQLGAPRRALDAEAADRARARLRQITDDIRAYHAAVDAWDQTASSSRGAWAVRTGLAAAP